MTPKQRDYFMGLSSVELMARLIWGEARGESLEGQVAVGCVVMNRVKGKPRYGKTVHGVILKHKQFSCFNEDNPNFTHMLNGPGDDPMLNKLFVVSEMVILGYAKDVTYGATHYNTRDCDPTWDDNMKLTKIIKNHEFYLEI